MLILCAQVYPFVKQLKSWIKREKRRMNGGKNRAGRDGMASKHNGSEASTLEPKLSEATQQSAKPEAVKPLEPGQSWINFKFQYEDIMKHLVS